MPKKKSTPPAVPEVSQLRQLWEALNTRLVDLPDVPGLTMTRANTAGRAPAWRAPSNRSVMAESPSLSGSIARALQGSSRPTPVRPSPSQAVLGLGGQAVEALSSPLDLASLYFGGAGTLAKGVGLPALARLLGRTALAADVAQTVPAVVRGAQTFGEGVRTGRPELVVGGGAQGALGALGLKRTLGRGGRIVEAEEAFKRTPVSEPGEGFESIEIPAASKEEPGFWMRVPTRQISPEHPFRTGRVPYAILTSENPRGGLPEVMPLDDLTMELRRKGYSPVPVRGDYGGEERSLLIPGMPEDEAMALGRELQQNAIITQRGMQRSDNPVIDVPIDVESKPGATEYFSEFRDPATGQLEKMAFDFGPTPDFDPARGARALAPMRRELEGAGPMVLLQHRSTSPRLAGGELRPSAVGMRTKAEQAMGTPGAERGRFMRYPDVFQPRSYATVGGGQVEPLLQGKTSLFEGVTPMRRIYDLAEDPLNLRAVAEEKAQQYAARLGKFPSLDLTETFLEKEVADQGFLGATYGPWRSQLSRGWEFGSPLPEKATTPRGDQLMLFQPFRMNRTR